MAVNTCILHFLTTTQAVWSWLWSPVGATQQQHRRFQALLVAEPQSQAIFVRCHMSSWRKTMYFGLFWYRIYTVCILWFNATLQSEAREARSHSYFPKQLAGTCIIRIWNHWWMPCSHTTLSTMVVMAIFCHAAVWVVSKSAKAWSESHAKSELASYDLLERLDSRLSLKDFGRDSITQQSAQGIHFGPSLCPLSCGWRLISTTSAMSPTSSAPGRGAEVLDDTLKIWNVHPRQLKKTSNISPWQPWCKSL